MQGSNEGRCPDPRGFSKDRAAGAHKRGGTRVPYPPDMHNNLEQRWLKPRLQAMKIDEKGMGFHAFRRFRKTWLRGERCQEDINNFWMGHQPETMSELYSRMEFELERRLDEAEKIGVGFIIPAVEVAPSAPRSWDEVELELAVQEQ